MIKTATNALFYGNLLRTCLNLPHNLLILHFVYYIVKFQTDSTVML